MPNRSQNHDGVILGRPEAGKSFSQLLFNDEDWAKKNLNTITLGKSGTGMARRVIIPLSEEPHAGESIILTNPKSESQAYGNDWPSRSRSCE